MEIKIVKHYDIKWQNNSIKNYKKDDLKIINKQNVKIAKLIMNKKTHCGGGVKHFIAKNTSFLTIKS